MTVIEDAPIRLAPSAKDLQYLSTVDRRMLHRRAISEVFLTSAAEIDDNRFLAGAQLPPAHPYYTDNSLHYRLPDPLLLLECCRQAETYAAHAFHAVPMDSKFILRTWSWQRTGPAPKLPPGPADLVLEVATRNPQVRDGALRGLEYDMDLWLGDASLGTVHLAASYVPAGLYPAVRAHGRGSQPPLSDAGVVQPQGPSVPPHMVGRVRPENSVLANLRFDGATVSAQLRVPTDHPSMFDHPLDHVPGMVAMEAARQIALVAANDRRGSLTRLAPNGLHGDFARYIELDAPTTVHAVPETGDDHVTVRVSIRQGELEAAAITVRLGNQQAF